MYQIWGYRGHQTEVTSFGIVYNNHSMLHQNPEESSVHWIYIHTLFVQIDYTHVHTKYNVPPDPYTPT